MRPQNPHYGLRKGAWERGWRGYRAGLLPGSNPYVRSGMARAWLEGWRAARESARQEAVG